jgi:hypothetical protein
MNKTYKILLNICGLIFVGLAILGIFLPLLPTTPFLLLASACFFRGSDKLYNWLINSKYFGTYIKNYRENKYIPLKVKISAICLLWVTIIISTIFVVKILWITILAFAIASAVTLHIVYLGKNKKIISQKEKK